MVCLIRVKAFPSECIRAGKGIRVDNIKGKTSMVSIIFDFCKNRSQYIKGRCVKRS